MPDDVQACQVLTACSRTENRVVPGHRVYTVTTLQGAYCRFLYASALRISRKAYGPYGVVRMKDEVREFTTMASEVPAISGTPSCTQVRPTLSGSGHVDNERR